MKMKFVRRIHWVLMILLAFALTTPAQEKPPASTASVQQEEQEAQAAKEKKQKEEQKAKEQLPLSDSMFVDIRNNATLSFGAYETYNSNVFDSNVHPQGDSFAFLTPRLFANLEKKNLYLSFDYSAGYRAYTRFSELNRWEQLGGLQAIYQVSRRTTFRIADDVSYVPLDNFGLLRRSVVSSPGGLPTGARIVFDRQNVFRNSVSSDVTYALSEPTTLRFYGSYSTTHYKQAVINNNNGFTVGFQLTNRVSRRLSLNTNYEFVYFDFPRQPNISRVHRLGVGFTYDLRPTISIYANGGPQVRSIGKISNTDGFFVAGIRRTTPTTGIAFEVQRSVATNLGAASVQPYYTAKIDVSHKFTPRTRLGFNAAYYRGNIFGPGGNTNSGYQGGPRFEYAMRENLMFIFDYFYLNQKRTGNFFAFGPPNVSRHSFSIGLEYRLPLLLHR